MRKRFFSTVRALSAEAYILIHHQRQHSVPATITFNNTSQHAVSYFWRFGDGDSTTITNPTHTYQVCGNYVVTLVARNSVGVADTAMKQLVITPGTVFINAITVTSLPFVNQSGGGWDWTTGPDVYVDLFADGNRVISTGYFWDVAPSDLPLQFTSSIPYRVPNWASLYRVELWDFDDISASDFIGTTLGYSINDIVARQGYTTTARFGNSSGSIIVDLRLTWR